MSRLDFGAFLDADPSTPPEGVSGRIIGVVHQDLNPGAWGVFLKLAAIHSVVGGLTLLVCPQFGVNLLGGMGLMGLFMRFGDTVCMIACGVVFCGGSLLAASLVLLPEEVRAVRRRGVLQIPLLALLSIGVFICLDPSILGGLAMFWLVGSIAGGFGTLELGWALRRRLYYA